MRIHDSFSFRRTFWVCALLSCLTVDARAQEPGWYMGVGAGGSLTDMDEDFWTDDTVTSAEIDKVGTGFNLYGGYRMNRHFALEVGYLRFADAVFTGFSSGSEGSIWNPGTQEDLNDPGPIEGHTELQGVAIQAVGLWPLLGGDLDLYLKGGMFMWDTLAKYNKTINDIHRFNDDGGTLIGGLGAEMRVWGDWRLRGEMQLTSVIFANRDTVMAGIATIGLVYSLN